jgi:hypothetical protein
MTHYAQAVQDGWEIVDGDESTICTISETDYGIQDDESTLLLSQPNKLYVSHSLSSIKKI